MKNRKNRRLKIALAIALFSIAVGCDRTTVAPKGEQKPAPTVSFQNLDGQTVNLAQYRGKVVLVNFWATWCEPCRSEIPELIRFQNEYASKGFTVLGVAMDQEGKSVVAPFAARPQFEVNGQKVAMNYPIVLGNDDVATKFGGIIGLPTSFLISRHGNIVEQVIGVINEQSTNQLIQKLL